MVSPFFEKISNCYCKVNIKFVHLLQKGIHPPLLTKKQHRRVSDAAKD